MRRRNQSADERPLRPDAFIRQAMGAWGGSVWRLALAQTGSKEDAEDVYQDVFLRLAQSATEFSSQEHLKAWLLRVTVPGAATFWAPPGSGTPRPWTSCSLRRRRPRGKAAFGKR